MEWEEDTDDPSVSINQCYHKHCGLTLWEDWIFLGQIKEKKMELVA